MPLTTRPCGRAAPVPRPVPTSLRVIRRAGISLSQPSRRLAFRALAAVQLADLYSTYLSRPVACRRRVGCVMADTVPRGVLGGPVGMTQGGSGQAPGHASSASRRRQAVGTRQVGIGLVTTCRDAAHASSAARRRQQVGTGKSVAVETATKALNAEPPDG
ncbi:MAG: hypothetical protein ACJAQ3_004182 [Planctomycetota bacterium]